MQLKLKFVRRTRIKKKRTKALVNVKIFSVLMVLMLCLVGWGEAIVPQVNAHFFGETENSYLYDEFYDMLEDLINRHFVDWFNTSATTGGARFRNGMLAPSTNTTYWARWTDPSRHLHYWTRPTTLSATTVINVRDFGYSSIWHNAMVQGITNWNSSSARVQFNRVVSSNNIIRVRAYRESEPTWLGSLTPSTNGTNLTSFTIQLYSDRINNHVTRNRINNPNGYAESDINTNITVARVVESIMTHELGHAIGLDDNPVGATAVNASIMNSGRQRWVRRVPSAFDITSVNMIY